MTRDDKGRLAARWTALVKPVLGLAVVLLLPALAACTTAEGTNAFATPATFEHEVMDSTLQGLDILPPDPPKPDPTPRAPLVMPKQVAELPPPTKDDVAGLPKDSDSPQVSTAGLSQADLAKLRNARVVDLQSLDGRPLTDAERRQLTARMAAATQVASSASRPLTLPPTSYFSSYKGKDAVCRASDGTLVSLSDSRCPAQIRKALARDLTPTQGVDQQINTETYDMANGIDPNEPK
ncbi:MAG TPA: hypothetical protein VHB74_07475 [Devosia sp.]|nr:hypothetical protein [Devosia sp.]